MGTLRLKRGTKTALQTNPGFTPAEGELVYTTDSKEVFVGDGVTQGGVPVSVSTQNLEDLGNVQALAAQKDQILVYNGSNWAATENPALDVRGNIYGDDSTLLVDAINGKIVGPVETSSVTATSIVGNLVGDTTGSHTGAVVGNLVGNTTGAHTGPVTGDLVGSVFADDSASIIDSVNNTLTIGKATADEITTRAVKVQTNEPEINITKDNDVSIIKMTRSQAGAHTSSDSVGRFRFATFDTTANAEKVQGSLTITGDNLIYIPSHDGVLQYANYFKVHKTGKVAINMGQTEIPNEPGATLEVNGNVKVSGANELLLGNMTTTERNALTASNGMIVYNTSDNKFQGYANGAWVNLH